MTTSTSKDSSKAGRSKRWRGVAVLTVVVAVGALAFDRVAIAHLTEAPNYGEPIPPAQAGERRVSSKLRSASIAYEVIEPTHAVRTVLVFHGLRSRRDSMRPFARALADDGARAVLVDARGHGRSTGDELTYGVYESQDAMTVLDDLGASGLVVGKVGALGFSNGGATVLQWAGRDPRVRAVVALAPFATMDFIGTSLPVPVPDFVVASAIARTASRWQFSPADAGGARWVTATDAPLLLVHGDSDRRVPPSDSVLLHERAKDHAELWIVPGATHAGLVADSDQAVRRRAVAFFAEHL